MEMDLTEKARPMSPRVPTVPGSHLGPSSYARIHVYPTPHARMPTTYTHPTHLRPTIYSIYKRGNSGKHTQHWAFTHRSHLRLTIYSIYKGGNSGNITAAQGVPTVPTFVSRYIPSTKWEQWEHHCSTGRSHRSHLRSYLWGAGTASFTASLRPSDA